MEYLSLLVERVVRTQDIKLISKVQPIISDLLYGDDLILSTNADIKSAVTLKSILRQLNGLQD